MPHITGPEEDKVESPSAPISQPTGTTALEVPMTARGANLSDLVDMLNVQQDVKYDVVVPSDAVSYVGGHLVIANGAAEITDTGVTTVPRVLAPTELFETSLSSRLQIPRKYMTRMRDTEGAIDLLDHNVNHWIAASERNWFVRGFATDDPTQKGIARAWLSDKYRVTDNYDVLLAALDGIREAGVHIDVTEGNLSERAMSLHVTSPEITAQATEIVGPYTSPFGGGDSPVLQAGLRLSNSETGNGAWTVTPRVVFQMCKNGWTVTKDAMRQVHLGGQMAEGEIKWSEDTNTKYIELIRAQTRDAIVTFLSEDYLMSVVDALSHAATVKLDHPTKAIEQVAKGIFNEAEQVAILDFFIRGGDTRAVAVGQAITAYSQTVEDPDRALELEDLALATTLHAARIG